MNRQGAADARRLSRSGDRALRGDTAVPSSRMNTCVAAPTGSTKSIVPRRAASPGASNRTSSGRTPKTSFDALLARLHGIAPKTPRPRAKVCHRDKVDSRAADEFRDEKVRWMIVDVIRRADLLQRSLIHDSNAIRHGHSLGLIMGDVERRGGQSSME